LFAQELCRLRKNFRQDDTARQLQIADEVQVKFRKSNIGGVSSARIILAEMHRSVCWRQNAGDPGADEPRSVSFCVQVSLVNFARPATRTSRHSQQPKRA
jgi:hypothetical protein